MPTVYLLESIPTRQSDDNYDPVPGARLHTWIAGTTTNLATYTDAAGTVLLPNPVVADSEGFFPPIWVLGQAYDFQAREADDTTVLWSRGNVNLGRDASSLLAYSSSLLASAGASLVGWISDAANAVARTVLLKLRDYEVTPEDFGADGTEAGNTAAINLMFASGKAWYIPRRDYPTNDTVTVTTSGRCDGKIIPSTSLGATPAVVIADPGTFGESPVIKGLKVWGSAAHKTAGVIGIRVDAPFAHLQNGTGFEMGRGFVLRSYGVTLTKCRAPNCALPSSAYARDASHEINALTIEWCDFSGNDSGTGLSIGDSSWPDALPDGNSHGVAIIIKGSNFDGGSLDIENVGAWSVKGCYWEGSPINGCAIRLARAGMDGSLRAGVIGYNFIKNLKIAVRCYAAVDGLTVESQFLTQVSQCALYTVSDLYHTDYTRAPSPTACFTNGTEWHTGTVSEPPDEVTAIDITDEYLGLRRGAQMVTQSRGEWWGGGKLITASSVSTMNASASGRYYDSPTTGIAGTVSGNVFTFSDPTKCHLFKPRDKIATSPAGATYVRIVDYDAGTATLDGDSTANGAATISQLQATFSTTYTVATAGGAPSNAMGNNNDFCFRTDPTVVPTGSIYQKLAGSWTKLV